MKAERKLYVPSKAKKHEENTHYNRKYWKSWIFVLKNRKMSWLKALIWAPCWWLCLFPCFVFLLTVIIPSNIAGRELFNVLSFLTWNLKVRMHGQFSIYIQKTKCSFFFFMLWRNVKIEGLGKENFHHPSSSPKEYSHPRNVGMEFQHQGRTFPVPECPSLLPQQKFLPSRSSQCCHSSTQFCQGDPVNFNSGDFWFPFPGWVFLTDCGAEWAGSELHLDRWSSNSQRCYYSHGGIMGEERLQLQCSRDGNREVQTKPGLGKLSSLKDQISGRGEKLKWNKASPSAPQERTELRSYRRTPMTVGAPRFLGRFEGFICMLVCPKRQLSTRLFWTIPWASPGVSREAGAAEGVQPAEISPRS